MQYIYYRSPVGGTVKMDATEKQGDKVTNAICFSIGAIGVGTCVYLVCKGIQALNR